MKYIITICALLSGALAATVMVPPDDTLDCSVYGDGYVPIESVAHVELDAGAMAKCLNKCASRKPQLISLDSKSNDLSHNVTKASCDRMSNQLFVCDFKNFEGEPVPVPFYLAVFNEYVVENPRCVLKGSLFVEYSTDKDALKKILIIGAVVLGVLVALGCAIAFFCGALCSKGCRSRSNGRTLI